MKTSVLLPIFHYNASSYYRHSRAGVVWTEVLNSLGEIPRSVIDCQITRKTMFTLLGTVKLSFKVFEVYIPTGN